MTMRMPAFARPLQAGDAPRRIENVAALAPRGGGPEFDNLDAAFEKLFECAEGGIFAFFRFFGDGPIEAKPVAESRSQGRYILAAGTSYRFAASEFRRPSRASQPPQPNFLTSPAPPAGPSAFSWAEVIVHMRVKNIEDRPRVMEMIPVEYPGR